MEAISCSQTDWSKGCLLKLLQIMTNSYLYQIANIDSVATLANEWSDYKLVYLKQWQKARKGHTDV